MVTRHFGESFFAARHLFPDATADDSLIDLGSGAGFPGVPIKIWAPDVKLTSIESQHKKAVFLREVTRALRFSDAAVLSSRAETLSMQADVVTLRAVESFESVLPVAAGMLKRNGKLALLIGERQCASTRSLLPDLDLDTPIPVPLSKTRVLLIGRAPSAAA